MDITGIDIAALATLAGSIGTAVAAVVNKSASNAMLVSYNDIDTSNPVSVSVTQGHAIILLCYAVQMIGDDSYCNLFCKVS